MGSGSGLELPFGIVDLPGREGSDAGAQRVVGRSTGCCGDEQQRRDDDPRDRAPTAHARLRLASGRLGGNLTP